MRWIKIYLSKFESVTLKYLCISAKNKYSSIDQIFNLNWDQRFDQLKKKCLGKTHIKWVTKLNG